jgi:UDP-N-acetylmuramate dehydrogenase
VVGDGTNLIVSDQGFSGIVLRFTAAGIHANGDTVSVQAGAELQALVDYCIDHELQGIETMTGIPGSVGAAIYGNAGAYGHSMEERVRQVRFFDGTGIRVFTNPKCEFRYRESIFKKHKEWVIFSAELRMDKGAGNGLRAKATEILEIRTAKYPPSMKCAGSIFKNLLWADLPEAARKQVPERVIREGKVPSAYFLEQVDAKGMRNGDIRVADYHELKARVNGPVWVGTRRGGSVRRVPGERRQLRSSLLDRDRHRGAGCAGDRQYHRNIVSRGNTGGHGHVDLVQADEARRQPLE